MNGPPIEDALRFLAAHPHVYLLSRRPDGYPTGYPMMCMVAPGGVEFSTYRSSAKVANLLREGVGTVLAVSNEPENLVLVARGTVSVHDGKQRLPTATTHHDETEQQHVPIEVIERVRRRHDCGKRCLLRLTLTDATFTERLG